MSNDTLKFKKEVMDGAIKKLIDDFYIETGIQVTETVIQWTEITPTTKCSGNEIRGKSIVSLSVKTEIRL